MFSCAAVLIPFECGQPKSASAPIAPSPITKTLRTISDLICAGEITSAIAKCEQVHSQFDDADASLKDPAVIELIAECTAVRAVQSLEQDVIDLIIPAYRRMKKLRGAERRQMFADNSVLFQDSLGSGHLWTTAARAGHGKYQIRAGHLETGTQLLLAALEQEQAIFGSKHPRSISTLSSIGSAYSHLAEYGKSERYYREALVICEQFLPADSRTLATPLEGLALIYYTQRAPEDIAGMLERALNIRTKHRDPRRAETLRYLGKYYMWKNDYAKAEDYLRSALKLNQDLHNSNPSNYASNLKDLAALCVKQRKLEEAQNLYHMLREITVAEHGPSAPQTAMLNVETATFLCHTGKFDDAIALLESAIDIYTKHSPVNHPRIGRAYQRLARALWEQGKLAPASEAVDKAIRILEEVAQKAGNDAEAQGSFRQFAPHDLATAIKIDQQNYEAAVAVLDRGRGRVLRHMLGGESHPSKDTGLITQSNLDDNTAIICWFDDFGSFTDKRGYYYGFVIRDNSVQCIPLTKRVNNASAKSELEQSLRTPLHANWAGPMHEIYLEMVAPLRQHLQGVAKLIIIPTDSALLGIPAEALVTDLKSTRVLGEEFEIAYAQSIGVFNRIKAKRKPVTRHPALLAIGHPRFDSGSATIDQSQSPDSQHELLTRSSRSANSTGLPALPETATEVRAITANRANSRALSGDQAREEILREFNRSGELSRFDHIHFATHAVVDGSFHPNSAIILSQPSSTDSTNGFVHYDELFTLKLEADLVVLSACSTGTGLYRKNEGFLGFTHAFMSAGARRVACSLWDTDDLATAIMMQLFYTHLQELPAANALKLARNELRTMTLGAAIHWTKRYNASDRARTLLRKRASISGDDAKAFDHPYYWAPFVLMGPLD